MPAARSRLLAASVQKPNYGTISVHFDEFLKY
jgi:hypothetical protein